MFSEMVMFKTRSEGGRASHERRGVRVPGKRNGVCKCPESGMISRDSGNQREVRTAGAWRSDGHGMRLEMSRSWDGTPGRRWASWCGRREAPESSRAGARENRRCGSGSSLQTLYETEVSKKTRPKVGRLHWMVVAIHGPRSMRGNGRGVLRRNHTMWSPTAGGGQGMGGAGEFTRIAAWGNCESMNNNGKQQDEIVWGER